MNKHELRSEELKLFINDIIYKNRNPINSIVLDMLQDKASNPERIIKKRHKTLYRCRIIEPNAKLNQEPKFWGYSEKESFIPPRERTKDMRANYRYIPYLYCATDPYVAILEVRPRLNSLINVARITVKRDLTLLDLSNNNVFKNAFDAKNILLDDLSYLFSKPITDEDETIDYIPTQFIAEYIKNLGYDGIVYTSSLTPELHDNTSDSKMLDRNNIVIFNYDKCIATHSNVFQISNLYLKVKKVDKSKGSIFVYPINEEIAHKDFFTDDDIDLPF